MDRSSVKYPIRILKYRHWIEALSLEMKLEDGPLKIVDFEHPQN